MNIACVKGNSSHQDPSVQIGRGEIPLLVQGPDLIRWECIEDVHKMHYYWNRWGLCELSLFVIARCTCVRMCALVCMCVCIPAAGSVSLLASALAACTRGGKQVHPNLPIPSVPTVFFKGDVRKWLMFTRQSENDGFRFENRCFITEAMEGLVLF